MTITQSWIRLPAARKGARCPVSGYSRPTIQRLIYGQPHKGIPPKVRFRRTGGKGGKGIIWVSIPSLMQAILGEEELEGETVAALRGLAHSAEWCQSAFEDMLSLSQSRAGMTCAEFLCWKLKTSMPNHHGLFRDAQRPSVNDLPPRAFDSAVPVFQGEGNHRTLPAAQAVF